MADDATQIGVGSLCSGATAERQYSTEVEAVLIDSSGYASDCNFSNCMPQHAMKPYRALATMELIRALGLLDAANSFTPLVRRETGDVSETQSTQPLDSNLPPTSSFRASSGLRSVAKVGGTSHTMTTGGTHIEKPPHKKVKKQSLSRRKKRQRSTTSSADHCTLQLLQSTASSLGRCDVHAGPRTAIGLARTTVRPRCVVVVPPLLPLEELQRVHAVSYLANLGLHNTGSWLWHPSTSHASFSVDCPPVEGIVEHSLATASGSLMGAVLLNTRRAHIAMHWGGGMHHAKCGECCGFCYINDIVLAITELLKAHDRVLYVDLDVHHGDGVDEAFCQSDRVFTLSLHKFGDSFFPGTGHPRDCGHGKGKHYSMNLGLWDGITDFFYISIFRQALRTICAAFQPQAVVLQCGADSLGGDRLGTFNLTSWGHGECVRCVRSTGLPILAVGGGGYTIRNVAKLWAYETSVLCGAPLPTHTMIPVSQMPHCGWLFEDHPVLGVPTDATTRPPQGWQVQRGYRSVLDQIARAGAALREIRFREDGKHRTSE